MMRDMLRRPEIPDNPPVSSGTDALERGNSEDHGRWIFSSHNFMALLDEGERAALHAIAKRKLIRRGQHIYGAGDPAERIYIVDSGRVKMYQSAPSGKEIILWFCFPGESFGLAELCRGMPRTTSAQAVEDSYVLSLSKADFMNFLGEHPAVALCVIDVLSTRLRRLGQTFLDLATEEVSRRLARLILGLAHGQDRRPCGRDNGLGEICINITMTHQDMADMIGASRQTVTTALNDFKRQGALCWVNHHIHLLRPDLLEATIRDDH